MDAVTLSVTQALFWLGVAVLMAHELDAVRAREWRLLYVLRRLPEESARAAFIVLHVPLLMAMIWLGGFPDPAVRTPFQAALDLFLIVHAGLHKRLEHHPFYDFDGALSRALIIGAALAGALHLVLLGLF
jgi:hypothetical protein